ncbi:hypothetical protein FRC02_000829 [Tulasnella sp. 418]|nr:hypothetical protein FRC02_000829 [Tulasnella sp. 418]
MFLFLVGVAFFLWPLSRNISILEIALSGAGLGIYITSILIGIFVPTSPFQTPVSKYAPRYLARIRSLFHFKPRDMVRRSKEYWRSTIRAHMGNADSLSLASGRSLTRSEIRRGIVGWLKSMRSRSDSKRPRALHWDPKTIANAECVLWLLENAEHPDVTITALDAIQRLPPTLLYPLMLERGSLWDRMVSYHRSLLPHKPTSTHGAGWLKLWPDSAIISGMALCHVLKGRGPQDELLRTPLPYVGWSPSLGEDLSDPGVVARYAIACFLEMQPDDPSSSTLTLRRALETAIPKALSSSVLSIPLTDIRNSLVNQTFSTSVISLPLLLDSIILRTRRQEDMPSSYHFRRREEGEKVEALLQSLCVVLQNQPSRDIVSHVAITVAVVQWWNRSNPSSPFWSYPRPQNVKRFEEQVDDSLKEMDKGKYAADNIALAFSVIDATTSYSATLLYKTLLPIAEQISEDSGTGHTIHFSHFAPSLLRLAEQCTAHADTNHRIVRLLKKCGDGDWCTLPQDVRAIANLLGSALSLWRTPAESNMYTLVSGISLLHEMAKRSDPARLREIIVTQGGLYQHRRAISRLNSALRSWAANASADFSGMALGLELDGAPDSPLLFSMQVELVVGILSLRYSGVNDALLDRSFKQVQRYFNHLMTIDANLRWPDYFAFLSLVSNGRLEPDDLDDTIFRSPSGVHNLGLNNYRLAVWRGEGILLLWRKARREHLNGGLPGDWNDSAFFEAETVDTMLDYFEHTTSHPRHWFDQSTLVDYFERVRRIRWELQDEFRLSFGDEQREVVEKLAEQRPTRIDGVVNFLCNLGTLAGPVPRAP